MSMTEGECAAFGCPGAAAIVRYTQAGAPLVRLLAVQDSCISAEASPEVRLLAVQDSCISAEASPEWATVAHGGDQADGPASHWSKGGGFSRQHAVVA
jgi:hypothetical protein